MQRTKIGEAAGGGKGGWMDMTAFHGTNGPHGPHPPPWAVGIFCTPVACGAFETCLSLHM